MTQWLYKFRMTLEERRKRRDLGRLDSLLRKREAVLHFYREANEGWLEVAGTRLYFDDAPQEFSVTTFADDGELKQRRLSVHYRKAS